MAGYTRVDTINNIADGNVINAADLDGEFDGIQAAFNSSTGHNHDGTAGEGAPILALGPAQDVTISSSVLGVKTTNTVDLGTSSLKFKDFYLAGNASIGGTLDVTGVATLTAQPILSSLTASRAVFTDASKGLVSNAITGTGNVVMSASPTLTGTLGAAAATFSGAVALNGNSTLGDASTDTVTVNGTATFNASPIISVTDNTNAALRITQLGTGNALLVEDSTNPDATPFVIDAGGNTVVGATSAYVTVDSSNTARTPLLQNHGLTQSTANTGIFNWSSSTGSAAYLSLNKSKSGTVGTQTAVSSGDDIGAINFAASDGTAFVTAANILAEVDGTPGTNDMPGRLVFSTTADGASSPTTRMTIYSDGSITVGASQAPSYSLRVGRNISGAANGGNFYASGTIQSDVTSNGYGFLAENKTAATAFTLGSYSSFRASQGTFGVGSAVTNQYGFNADSSLVGATNNYGFYGNIASGTGRYNFYANGTAENYFGGNTTISVTDNTNAALRVTQLGTGNALLVEDSTNPDSTPFVIDSSGRVSVGTTEVGALTPAYNGTQTNTFVIAGITQGPSSSVIANWGNTTTPTNLIFSKSRSGVIGTHTVVSSSTELGKLNFEGSDGTAFIQAASILAAVDGTPGTNDMPGRLVFSTTADGASTPTERMRITSAASENILFGLTVSQGTGRVQSIGDSATAAYLAYSSSTSQREAFRFVNGNGEIASFGMNGTSLTTTVGGAERMRIDSSGNMGLGVTPSAWRSTSRVMQFNSGGFLEGRTDNPAVFEMGANGYLDSTGTWKYLGTGTASLYSQSGGHYWYNAASGTAGNTISFTQAMSLDASGNVGIGRLPNYQLDVYRSGTTNATIASANDNVVNILQVSGNTAGVVGTLTSHPLVFTIGNTERMRIDTSGNVGIGTSSPTAKLDILGGIRLNKNGDLSTAKVGNFGSTNFEGYIEPYSSSGWTDIHNTVSTTGVRFFTGNSDAERMRIDSSGNLLVGTTSQFNSGKQCIAFNGTNNYGLSLKDTVDQSAARFIGFINGSGTAIGGIDRVTTTNAVQYLTSSDYRLKENIQPMTGALQKVASLKPVTYTWKDGGAQDEGFIAHELQEVVPACVSGEKDGVDAEGNPKYQGIDTSFLVATLTAAIQEQQAIITQLQADVAALKGTA
jgi:hypothetical protein